MSKPCILLYSNVNAGRLTLGGDYVRFFSQFGRVRVITTYDTPDELLEEGDILAVPGGADVDPRRYGERPAFECGDPDIQYEWLDEHLLTPWIQKTNKPVLGICRGLQTINVVLNGTLHQDIHNHEGGKDRSYVWQNLHTYWPDIKVLKVNSYHHQGIKKLGDGLVTLGFTTLTKNCPSLKQATIEDNIWLWNDSKSMYYKSKYKHYVLPEVIVHESKPILAFQYHPENTMCDFATSLIRKMLRGENLAEKSEFTSPSDLIQDAIVLEKQDDSAPLPML